jgi:hypothetical protein
MALEQCNEDLKERNSPLLTMETLKELNKVELQNGKLCHSFPIGMIFCCMARH